MTFILHNTLQSLYVHYLPQEVFTLCLSVCLSVCYNWIAMSNCIKTNLSLFPLPLVNYSNCLGIPSTHSSRRSNFIKEVRFGKIQTLDLQGLYRCIIPQAQGALLALVISHFPTFVYRYLSKLSLFRFTRFYSN